MPQSVKPAVSGEFTGFTEEALAFLKKLAKNNRREWFQPRKETFEDILQKPMAQFLFAIERELKKSGMSLSANPKSVLFRIYRDIRFSSDKSPYHTFVSGALYHHGDKKAPGMIYVHVGEKERFAAAGFWQPERTSLTNWRLAMREEPKKFLDAVKRLERKNLAISSEHSLHRMPRGFEALDGTPIARYVRLQSFVVMRPITASEVLEKDLPSVIAKFALDAKPLLAYGWALPETKPALFID